MPDYHPESPERIGAITQQLIAENLLEQLVSYEAPMVTREQLARVHTAEYIDTIWSNAPTEGYLYLDMDTSMGPGSLAAAQRAAGAAVLATELVFEGKVSNAFCNIRPPGHHAGPDYAMGFCIFNNVAVGVMHAIAHYGLQRVAIADFDVHHGNGTEEIFRNDPRVMLCSTFQHPFYPHSGADSSSDHMVNVPLPTGTGSDGFRAAVEDRWIPALEQFQPEMIFFSAGFDGHENDGMASLRLHEDDYAWVTQRIMEIADIYSKNRIVSLLEGGYALPVLGRSAAAHIRTLMRI